MSDIRGFGEIIENADNTTAYVIMVNCFIPFKPMKSWPNASTLTWNYCFLTLQAFIRLQHNVSCFVCIFVWGFLSIVVQHFPSIFECSTSFWKCHMSILMLPTEAIQPTSIFSEIKGASWGLWSHCTYMHGADVYSCHYLVTFPNIWAKSPMFNGKKMFLFLVKR